MTGIKRLADLPTPPTDGLMGHLKTIKSARMHKQLLLWSYEYNGLYRIRLANRKAVVVAQRSLLQYSLKNRPAVFRRYSVTARVLDELNINGIFSAEGENWQHQRELINNAFNGARLRYFFPAISRITNNLVSKARDLSTAGESIDVKTLFAEYTLDTISSLVFAYDINTLNQKNDPLHGHLSAIFPGINARISSLFPLWKLIKNEKDKKLEAGITALIALLKKSMANTRKKITDNPILLEQPENLLQAMLAECIKSNEHFSEDVVLSNAITFMLAGEDTTATALSWLSHLLSVHPDIQAAVRKEIQALPDGTFQQWPLPRIPLLNACIHESMRVKPIAPIMYLEACKDTTLRELRIPKGQMVVLLVHALAKDEDRFPDANQFNPYRWLSENNPSRVTDMAPFGGGARVCPGRSLALIEMKMAMCQLLKQFEFEAVDSSQVQEKFECVVMPDNLRIRLKAQTPSAVTA